MENVRSFYIAVLLVAGLLLVGTIGYLLIEDLSLLDALYMTVITATTVGFREMSPGGLSTGGRIFTMALIICGIAIGTYAIGSIIAFIIEGRLGHVIRRKRMHRKIQSLQDHYVVCGIGRTGMEVVKELDRVKVPYVAIDRNEKKVNHLIESIPGALALIGNATEETVLEEANIREARTIICALPNDADNIVAVLTARGLKIDLLIISRGVDEESVRKLERAGADHVILPANIAGIRMASFAVRPYVCDFLDFVTRGKDVTLRMEEVFLHPESVVVGKKLRESRIRQESDTIVIGIRRGVEMIINPGVETELKALDSLILLGTEEQLESLYRYLGIER